MNSAAAVKEAADRALALAPELGEAWLAQGTYRSRVLNDPAAALQAYREAERRLPNSALVKNTWLMRSAASAVGEKLRLIWPEQSSSTHVTLGFGPMLPATSSGLWDERPRRTQHYDRALEISPNNEFVIALKAAQYQQEGRLDEAAKELARIPGILPIKRSDTPRGSGGPGT